MTIITRYPTELVGDDVDSLPLMTWETGLNPVRRWLPGKLPAEGSNNVTGWAAADLSVLAPSSTPKASTVTEEGWRYAEFDGVSDNLTLTGLAAATQRTVMVIARPNTGDTVTGSGYSGGGDTYYPFLNTTGINLAQASAADLANLVGLTSPLAAARGHWHVYSYSLPDTGTGVFAVDGNYTTISAGASRNQITLTLGQQGANYRQMRILEVLTSADVFTGPELVALYAKAQAWYPELAW